MKILERLRLQHQIPITGKTGKENPLLKKQLEQTQKDLNLILNKWKFGDDPITSANEFLNNFEPWINKQLEVQKELKEFLKNKGVNNLSEIKEVPESEQLKFYKDNIKIKEGIIDDYKKEEEVWKNTEQDYLQQIQELKKNQGTSALSEEDKEKLAEYEDLISERDEAIRDKKTLEQQNLALNNQLKLKQQEVSNKDKALDKLKKEKDKQEVNHQKALKEKNGLITTLNLETKELKRENEKLTNKNKELDKQNAKLVEELLKLDPGHVNM